MANAYQRRDIPFEKDQTIGFKDGSSPETLAEETPDDSFFMESLYGQFSWAEPSLDMYKNNPDLTAERRCRIVNWLLEVAHIDVTVR